MSITLEKNNPAIFNILPIKWDESPVSSLSTINLNFESLDTEICNLGFSATNIWNKIYDYTESKSESWDSAFTTLETFSGCWESTYTTVANSSAGWLCPITILYPAIISTYLTPSSYLGWLKLVFPTKNGTCVNYLNGQRLFLYINHQSIKHQLLKVSCTVRNPSGCMKFRCNPKNLKIKDRYISGTIGLEFLVSGGQWTFVKRIGE